MNILFFTICLLGGLGLLGAAALYFVAKKFKVYEDPRIDDIERLLPGANCGGCGLNGCRDFAVKCVKAGSLEGLNCTSATAECMQGIANVLGVDAAEVNPQIAVLKCSGDCTMRTSLADYDGVKTCAIMSQVVSGESACGYGCLGCGDCAIVCPFDAITINQQTGLPEISEEKCTGCGCCTRECPRKLLELRPRGRRGMRVWIACANRDRGAVARKDCKQACLGDGLCAKSCPFEAITISDNLAYIDATRCKACRKCVNACPTGVIKTANFPVKQPKAENNETVNI